MFNRLRTLPSTVWLVGLVSFSNDTAGEMLYPLVPLYLASVLMAGPRALGIIEGIAEAASSLLKLFSGVIVDRTRTTKPWIVAGYALAGFGRPLIAFSTSWLGVLAVRFADRVGKGLRTSPRDALIARSVPAEIRGLAYGLHRSLDNAGSVIGPLLAAAFLSMSVPLKTIFLWAFVPGVITLLLTMLIKEPPMAPLASGPSFSWTLQGLPPAFKRYLVVVALFTLGNSSNMFLLLRARDLGLPEYQVPLLWAAVSAVAMLLSTPLSALSDTIGRKRLLASGWLAYGLFYVAMGLLETGAVALYLLFAFYGVFMAATEGVEKALVADLAPSALTGTAFGWFNLVAAMMLFPASFVFGWLYESFKPMVAFSFSATCAWCAMLLLVTWVLPASARHARA